MSNQEEMVLVEINAEELVTYEQTVRMKRADAERLERMLNAECTDEQFEAMEEVHEWIDRSHVSHADDYRVNSFELLPPDAEGDA